MGLPKNDLPLEMLRAKWTVASGRLYERLEMCGQEAWYPPTPFMRGEYLCLYYSKGIHMALHRVVWMLHNNIQIPRDDKEKLFIIDHFDGDKLNNAPWNLRLVTHGENMSNKAKVVVFG